MEIDDPNNDSKLETSKNSKKRGRPRLYEVDPATGKSVKGRLITPEMNKETKTHVTTQNNIIINQQGSTNTTSSTNVSMPIHLSSGGIAIFPSQPVTNPTTFTPTIYINTNNSNYPLNEDNEKKSVSSSSEPDTESENTEEEKKVHLIQFKTDDFFFCFTRMKCLF